MHDFRTGIFKNKYKSGDLAKFFANPTSAQLNFIHEVTQQHLGAAPSAHWGRQVIPFRLQGVDPEVLRYVAHATRQPKHEFQRLMVSDHHLAKKGAGVIGTIGRALRDVGEVVGSHVGQLVNTAAKFAKEHATTIENALQLGKIGASVATMTGLIKPSTGARIHSGANLLTKKTKPKQKEGGAWIDFV
mgnify:FL=1